MIRTAVLALLLAGTAGAQEIPNPPAEQTFELPRFTEGLNTRYASNMIPDNALAEALNVLLDEDVDGVPVRRNGHVKCNVTAINGAAVRGLWKFDAADGSKHQVAVASDTFYSHDGDCVFGAISPALSGFSTTREWDCTQYLGKLWCANGASTVWMDLAGSTASVTEAPHGTLNDGFRNRILEANVTGNQSRLYMSGELDGEDWTIGPTQSTSPIILPIGGVNDGNRITCLMGVYGDSYLIGKQDSLYALSGFEYDEFAIREVSREVGCIDDKTVQEKNNAIYWMSKRGYEKLYGSAITRVSDPIKDIIETIIATTGNPQTRTDTTQGDFEAGNLSASGPGAPLSATISPGNVVPSTWTAIDTSSTNFVDGTRVNLSTEVAGAVVLSSSVFQDNFDDGDRTAGQAVWSDDTGSSVVTDGILVCSAASCGPVYTPMGISTGSFRFKMSAYPSVGDNAYVKFISAGQTLASNGYALRYERSDVGHRVVLYLNRYPGPTTVAQTAAFTPASGNADDPNEFTVYRSTIGVFSVYSTTGILIGPVTDTTFSYSSYTLTACEDGNCKWDNFYYHNYSSYGVLTSRIFDTGLSTPTWGLFAAAVSSGPDTGIAFKVQASTAGDGGGFETLVSQNLNAQIGAAKRRYVRYEAAFSSELSTKTPTFFDAALAAGTTGYFIGQCQNPGTAITQWGVFQCNTTPNDGSLSFWVSTGASCNQATRATATWNAQTNGANITIATAPFVAYRVLEGGYSVFYASAMPALHDCSIGWQAGATRPPLASAVYDDRIHLAYTSSTAAGAANSNQLILDKNDKWTLFNAPGCYSLSIYERELYCGSSAADGFVYRMDSGTNDDGASFTSLIKTKAYAMGRPDVKKEYRMLGVELEAAPDSSYSIANTFKYALDRSTATVSLGTLDLEEDMGHLLWAELPLSITGSTIGRYIQLQAEVTGVNSPWRFYRGLLKYRPLRED